MEQDFKIKITKNINIDQMITLYKEAGWLDNENDRDSSHFQSIVAGSFKFAAVFLNEDLVGMGRALSDQVSDAYIQDVVVLKKYRGFGLGKKIIEELVKELKKSDIRWIGLIAEPGTTPFYEKLGFEPMKNYIPMINKR